MLRSSRPPDLAAPGAAGSGAITFGVSADPTVEFTPAHAPTHAIKRFGQGDTLVVQGFVASSIIENAPTLELIANGITVSLDLPGADFKDLTSLLLASGASTLELRLSSP